MNRRELMHASVAAGVAAALGSGRAAAAALAALTEARGDIEAIKLSGGATTLARATIAELAGSLRGLLLLPGADGYEAARKVMNPDIDKHPALIVRPTGVADIRQAVTFAAEHELLLAVKCGGHSLSGKGTCDGGMQIDLSGFRHVRVDAAKRRAYVAGGSLLGELDHEAMAHGLVTTSGTVSHTGVGGLTLGGGFGRVARRFGLALDNVRSLDLVTADGALRHASADENPELYWALRGGGGNFGVVTNFEFELHPMERQVVGGRLVFPIARAKELLTFYAEYSAAAPRELYVDFFLASPPGRPGAVLFSVCYSGSEREAERALAPLRKLGEPLNDSVRRYDYVALQRSSDNTDPRTGGTYMKTGFVTGIDAPLIDAIVSGTEPHPERSHVAFFQHSGGAVADIAANATAFAHRYATHDFATLVSWGGDSERQQHVDFLRGYWKTVERHTSGYYFNSSWDEGQSAINGNYRQNFDRLVDVKRAFDPANLFRLNANIRPG